MTAIINDFFRIDNANLFKNGFLSDAYYMTLGRTLPWVGTEESPLADDNYPPNPSDSPEKTSKYWYEAFGAKRIQAADVSLMIPRYDWVNGTVYSPYASNDGNLFQKKFFVITDELHVYKVIDNNVGAASTVKPTGTSTSIFSTSDGYRWKFMFTVSPVESSKFLTPQFIPVHLATVGDGSDQSVVQAAAVRGQIVSYRVKSGGTGYTTGSITVTGDGTGATATPVFSGGALVKVVVTGLGQDYTYATVSITGNGTGAAIEANTAPEGGHGSNAPYELGAYYVAMAVRFEYTEGGFIATEADFRQIMIVKNPITFGTVNTPYTDTRARQTTRLTLNDVTGYVLDEYVDGASSGAYGHIIEIDETNKYIYLADVHGTFQNEVVLGRTSNISGSATAIDNPNIKLNSGRVVYIENRKPQPRDTAQVERIITLLEW